MFEIIVLFMIGFLFATCAFSPLAVGRQFFSKSEQLAGSKQKSVSASSSKQAVHGESVSFLAHLKKQIEAELYPRPTCSVLQRHYDAMVAVELKNRLALMAE